VSGRSGASGVGSVGGVEGLARLALSLPEVTEQDHHGMPSFRVNGKIIATVPDPGHVRVMAPEAEIHAAVAEDAETFCPYYWGKRLSCVVVDLERVGADGLYELLADAWSAKAPDRLVGAFRPQPGRVAPT
jgi:hypothetical protein